MSSDKPRCKDTETARSLIGQMKGEVAGRKPSTYRDAQSPKYDVPEVGKKWVVPRVDAFSSLHAREVASSVGRFGNHHVRTRLEDCGVGDVVELEKTPFREGDWCRIQIRSEPTVHWNPEIEFTRYDQCAERLFKRITQRLTSDNGRTFKEESFWQRMT